MLVQDKLKKRNIALRLRKIGKSYREISTVLRIPKSSISYWVRNIELTKKQRFLLRKKQELGRLKGAQTRKEDRIVRENLILKDAAKEVSSLSRRELWLLGTIAYWCEGAKQKRNNVSSRVVFVNSDPFLIKLFVKWTHDICMVGSENLVYSLYIHETGNLEKSINYWSQILNISVEKFAKTIIKKHNISTNRKYDNDLYFGLLRIAVRNSTDLNRKIKGWANGIENCLN